MMMDHRQSLGHPRPIVHCIMSHVSASFVANCLTAAGASPLISHAEHEFKIFTDRSDATFINLYTDLDLTRTILNSIQQENYDCHPFVIDPVGAAISPVRRNAVLRYLSTGSIWILRGNASEIKHLVESASLGNAGIDSVDTFAREWGVELAVKYQCPVWISGEKDYLISSSGRVEVQAGGSKSMALVSGMGCAVTALLTAFLAFAKKELVMDITSSFIKFVNSTSESIGDVGSGSFPTSFLNRLSEH